MSYQTVNVKMVLIDRKSINSANQISSKNSQNQVFNYSTVDLSSDQSVDQTNQLDASNPPSFESNIALKKQLLTEFERQSTASQRSARRLAQDKLGRRYSASIEKLYLFGRQNGLDATSDHKKDLRKIYDRKHQLANQCALNDNLPNKSSDNPPNRINNQQTEKSNSLTSHSSEIDSDLYSDKYSVNSDCCIDESTSELMNSPILGENCAKLITSDTKFLNTDQLENYFKDHNLEEISLSLDDLLKSGQSSESANRQTIRPVCEQVSRKQQVDKKNQCLNKSPKSKFLAKRNSRQANKMNKEVLISSDKWIGQTSIGDSMGSTPILLSPCSSSSECPTSSVEMRLSNLGSSLSTYSICSNSSNVLHEEDETQKSVDRTNYFSGEMSFANEMRNKRSNDKQYELFDITRSMPSLDLIESLNSNSLPRLLKQFDSQPKLYDQNYQRNDKTSHNSSLIAGESISDSINDEHSLTNSQKLIMTRFGFIRKNVPVAKNLIMNVNCPLSEDERVKATHEEQSNKENMINDHLSEIKQNLLSTVDLVSSEHLNSSMNQRSLSALTINCDHRLNNKTFKFSCSICSPNLCKCKLKANSLLAINQHTLSLPPKPKLPKKPNLEVKHTSTGTSIENRLVDNDDAINCCNKHVDLYIQNKRLVNDNLKLQEKFDDLCESVQQAKNREERATNEQIDSLQRKVELLTLELQEAKDEKELIEFRLIELECSNNGTMAIETYNYHKAKEAFRNYKNVTRTIGSGLSSDESGSAVDNNNTSSSSDEAAKEQIDQLSCKKEPILQFTSSSVILTSEDEGIDDSSRRLYRSEDSGPSSLENSGKKLKSTSNLVDRCTSPLMSVDELEIKLSKLEQANNELVEQNLELEEAENDSRLVSQKLKIKVDNLLEQIESLQVNLEQSQEYIKTNESELKDFKKREDRLMEQIKEIQAKLDEENNISSLSTIDSSSDGWQLKNCKLSTLSNLIEPDSLNEQNQNPICNTIEPVKIDLSKSNYDDILTNQIHNLATQTSESNELNSLLSQHSIDLHLKALENNQDELNDRLKHLQTVNKEFVRDLEQREHLLTRKELLFKEWIMRENLLRRSIAELNNELDELNKQFNVSQRQRAELRVKCEELHHQLIELERCGSDCGSELSLRQKELHELIINFKQHEYDHRLVELINKFKMQFDAQCNKEMDREEQNQVILDKYCQQNSELEEKIRHLMTKQNELKDQIYKQQRNLEMLNKSYEENIEKLEEERVKISCKLKKTISTMENCTSKTIEDNQFERNEIKDKLNDIIKSFKSSQETYERMIKQLDSSSVEQHQHTRQSNLATTRMKSANDQLLSEDEQEAINNFKMQFDAQCNKEIERDEQMQSLLKERDDLKAKVSGLEYTVEQFMQKEDAYKETLIKADKIVYEMECQYKSRIEQLESRERVLSEQVRDLEKQQLNSKLVNSNLRNSLASSLTLVQKENPAFNLFQQTAPKTSTAAVSGLSSPQQIRRNSELVAELLKCESRECKLIEQINKLEHSEMNLKRRLEQSNEEKRSLESDLYEIDELNNKIEKLRKDLHHSMQQLDLERAKCTQFSRLIEEKESDFKKELNELLDENRQLRTFIKQQHSKLSQEHMNSYVNVNIDESASQISVQSNSVNKSHVLKINVNETADKNQNMKSDLDFIVNCVRN